MRTVILRHYPEVAPALEGLANAFAPWRRVATPSAPARSPGKPAETAAHR
jgi:hypothetical protein